VSTVVKNSPFSAVKNPRSIHLARKRRVLLKLHELKMISNRVNPTINTSKGFDIPIYNYQTYVEHQQHPQECNAQ